MQGKRLFLKWTLFTSLIAIGAFIGASTGWIGYLKNDPTHITLATLTVFAIATAWLGRLSWKLSNGHDPEVVREELDHGWFASSLCVSIGLIGTAVGYYLMLQHGNAGAEASEVIRQTFANTSIAIVNTVFGAVCGVLIEIQSHFIGHAAKKALRAAGKPVKEDEP